MIMRKTAKLKEIVKTFDIEGTRLKELKEKILSIPGDKIVTIFCPDSINSMVAYDISSNGKIGYESGHSSMFYAKLFHAFACGGSIIIREFTKDMIPVKNNNITTLIPKKNIYGIELGNNNWIGITKELLKESFSYDADTRKPKKIEAGLVFCNF